MLYVINLMAFGMVDLVLSRDLVVLIYRRVYQRDKNLAVLVILNNFNVDR